jgi:hypothetical protein
MRGRILTGIMRRVTHIRVHHCARRVLLNWQASDKRLAGRHLLDWHATVIADLGHNVPELVIFPRAAFSFDAWCNVFVYCVGFGARTRCVGSGAPSFAYAICEAVHRAGGKVVDCLRGDESRECREDDRVLHDVLVVQFRGYVAILHAMETVCNKS